MTAETMTVHKALAELKILGGRIEGAILSGDFVITKKNNQDTVKGKIMTSARMTYVSVPFVCRRTISPSFGCQSSSLAFVLIRRFSSPYRPGFRNLLTDLYPPLSAATTCCTPHRVSPSG